MGIYIDMEMPKEDNWRSIRIYPDGTIGRPIGFGDYALVEGAKAVPVPPHGDLIDKKTVSENLASVLNKKNPPFSYPDWNDAIVAMMTAPTIIPAEEGE
jgi:hypothetical protein